MKFIFNVFCLSSCFISCVFSTEHWIFIHGTFSAKNPWHASSSETHQALKRTLAEKDDIKGSFHIHSFVWSGHNNHKARSQAAQELIAFLITLSKTDSACSRASFHLIGHSHGATIALLAAQHLHETKQSLAITELFCLGAPLYVSWYQEAHKKIQTIYNLFSYGDGVQSLGGIFQRVFPKEIPAHNVQIIYDFQSPRHTQLHDPKLIAHLPRLKMIKKYLDHDVALYVKKSSDATVHDIYVLADSQREKDLVTDKAFMHQIMGLYAETRMKLSRMKRMKTIHL